MSAPASSPCYATDAAVAAHHHDHNTQQHAAHVHGHSSSLATAATASPAVSVSAENEIHRPFASTQARAHCSSFEQYQAMYKRSITDSDAFWKEVSEKERGYCCCECRRNAADAIDRCIHAYTHCDCYYHSPHFSRLLLPALLLSTYRWPRVI